jgi:long-chain fatty acid transport protein
MTLRLFSLSCAAATIALSSGLAISDAQAAGFYIQEQSSYHLGMAFAGVAADPVDASTAYYNPAGLASLDRAQMQMGSHLIIPSAKIKNTGSSATTAGGFAGALTGEDGGNPYDPELVPNMFAAYPASDNHDIWIGFALTAPFGLGNEYEDDFFGRYDSTESKLKVIDFSPSVSWKVNDKFSVGAGINVQYADAHLENALPSPGAAGPDPSTDGSQDLSGNSTSLGYNVGVLWTPQEDLRFGVHYRHGIDHELRGRVVIDPVGGGAQIRVPGVAELDLPAIASLAAAYDVNEKWTVQGHVMWFGWSVFDDIPVLLATNTFSSTEQNYEDTYAMAIGFKYKLDEQWELKAGYQFDQSPATDGFRSTRTPDGDRNWYSLGATYKLNDHVSFDLSGTYIDVKSEKIDLTRDFDYGGGLTASVDINGETEGDVGIVAVGMSYKF